LLASFTLGLGIALFAIAPGCSSDDSSATTSDASTGTAGGGGSAGTGGSTGATAGGACPTPTASTAMDETCTDDAGPIKQAAPDCPMTLPEGGDDDGGTEETYTTHGGTSSPDDDCKYDVSYTVDCSGGTVAFVVTLKSRTTGMLLTGANPSIESFLSDTHPLPSPEPVTTVVSDGVYKIAGVHFDAPGTWTVRFHFFEECLDIGETTKHAHVAFAVNVP
jgi:hypothetical protein